MQALHAFVGGFWQAVKRNPQIIIREKVFPVYELITPAAGLVAVEGVGDVVGVFIGELEGFGLCAGGRLEWID